MAKNLRPFYRNGEVVYGMEADMSSLIPWQPTVTQVRETILRSAVVGPDFQSLPIDPIGRQFAPTQKEVDMVNTMTREAVQHGRMIDFGNLPNDVIKQGGERGGTMWNAKALGQPFVEPWILYHTWDAPWHDGGIHRAVAVYLVNPIGETTGDVEVCELQPGDISGEKVLLVSDRGLFKIVEGGLPDKKYECVISPSMLRFIAAKDVAMRLNNAGSPASAAAGNIGDPLMTALMILNTRGVERETIEAPDKLNRARLKNRKPPIPPYDRVNTKPYVTAIMLRHSGRRSESHGGTHASPIPHIRLGHPRQYASGRSIFVRDTLVNVTDEQREAFRSARSHYAIKS